MHGQRRHHPTHTSKAGASSRCTAKAQLGARVTAHVAQAGAALQAAALTAQVLLVQGSSSSGGSRDAAVADAPSSSAGKVGRHAGRTLHELLQLVEGQVPRLRQRLRLQPLQRRQQLLQHHKLLWLLLLGGSIEGPRRTTQPLRHLLHTLCSQDCLDCGEVDSTTPSRRHLGLKGIVLMHDSSTGDARQGHGVRRLRRLLRLLLLLAVLLLCWRCSCCCVGRVIQVRLLGLLSGGVSCVSILLLERPCLLRLCCICLKLSSSHASWLRAIAGAWFSPWLRLLLLLVLLLLLLLLLGRMRLLTAGVLHAGTSRLLVCRLLLLLWLSSCSGRLLLLRGRGLLPLPLS